MTAFNLVGGFVYALLFLHGARAMPWIEPDPTPAGLMEMAGMSPRPTQAPGPDGIPRELLKRAYSIAYPPPSNWCGFIDGDYDNPVTCPNLAMTCAFTKTVAACCSTIGGCSDLVTSCLASTQSCGSSCLADPSVLWCTLSTRPYCGTYAFSSGYNNYYCAYTTSAYSRVQLIRDFYATRTSAQQTARASASSSQYDIPNTTTKPSSADTTATSVKLAVGAIAGIAVGGFGSLAFVVGIIAFLCFRKRNRNRAAAANQPGPPPMFDNNTPMQQPFVGQGYQNQPSPYSDPAYGPPSSIPSPPYTSTQASTYGGPPPGMHSPLNDPSNRMSNISPPPFMQTPAGPHKDPLPPRSPVSEIDIQRMNTPDAYKHHNSPTITEVSSYLGHAGAPASPPIGTHYNLAHEVSAEPLYTGHPHRPQTAGGGIHEVSASQVYTGQQNPAYQSPTFQIPAQTTNAHEVPAQSEPRYVAYNPNSVPTSPDRAYHGGGIPNQAPHNGAPASGAPQQPHAGPWELSGPGH